MPGTTGANDLSDRIAADLPYLRRYARALTGSQGSGDRYAIATLEAILQDRSIFEEETRTKIALYKCFHAIWGSSGAPVPDDVGGPAGRAHALLGALAPNTREALLLATVEDFSIDEISTIMSTDRDEVRHLIAARAATWRPACAAG